jgi:MoaD family protein
VNVNFYATFRAMIGQKTKEIQIPAGSTIRQLVDTIINLYPDFQGQLLDENGELFRHIHVFINGRDAYYLPKNLDTVLTQQEKIDIFPPVGGG